MARILLAEDDPSLSRILVRWMEAAGHEVAHAGNGLEGFRSATFGGAPDLLVTDLMMPESDGEELTGAFDLALPGRPVLVVTASSDAAMIGRVRACPQVRDILHKPVGREALLAAIEQALGTN